MIDNIDENCFIKKSNEMKYTCENYSDIRVLIIRLFGELYKNEVVLMDREIRLKASELNCKIVYDFRATTNHISITDAYYWFVSEYNKVLFDLRHIPVAQITNDLDKPFFDFFELTSNNKGAIIKNFRDEVSSIEWLNEFS